MSYWKEEYIVFKDLNAFWKKNDSLDYKTFFKKFNLFCSNLHKY